MVRIPAIAVAVLGLMSFFPSVLRAQEYDILLSRRAKVGDKYRLLGSGHYAETIMLLVGDNPVQGKNAKLKVELESSATVLEVNQRGGVTKGSLDIEKFVVTSDGGTESAIPPGTTVITLVDGSDTSFEIAGKRVDPLIERALRLLIGLDTGAPRDDDIFGTTEKKKVGDTWNINKELVVKFLADRYKVQTTKEDVDGASKLESVVKSGQEEQLLVNSWLIMSHFLAPLPPGFEMQTGQFGATMSGKLPVDQTKPPVELSTKLIVSFVATGQPVPNQPDMRMHGTFEQSATLKTEPLKAAK